MAKKLLKQSGAVSMPCGATGKTFFRATWVGNITATSTGSPGLTISHVSCFNWPFQHRYVFACCPHTKAQMVLNITSCYSILTQPPGFKFIQIKPFALIPNKIHFQIMQMNMLGPLFEAASFAKTQASFLYSYKDERPKPGNILPK